MAPAANGMARPAHLKLYYGPPDQAPPDVAIVIPEQSITSPDNLLVALNDPDPSHHVQPAAGPGARRYWTYDLIQTAFYLLSRQEEMDVVERDAMGRFSAKHSLLNKLGLIERPVLNEAVSYWPGSYSRWLPSVRRFCSKSRSGLIPTIMRSALATILTSWGIVIRFWFTLSGTVCPYRPAPCLAQRIGHATSMGTQSAHRA